jgi:hypothetical protein
MINQTVEHNVETGEIIEREATAEEIAHIENMKAKREAIQSDQIAKEAAKAALLEKLGITADEAKLLLA